VADYCSLLSEAFGEHGIESAVDRVAWDEVGWGQALWHLWRKSAGWKGDWVLVQYTALMWSRRGFSWQFLLVVGALKIRGARVAVVFHDVHPFAGKRLVDRVRRACQLSVMRWAYLLSSRAILNLPLENVPWLLSQTTKARFIPIPATIPPTSSSTRLEEREAEAKVITVLGITDGGDISKEVSDITLAAKRAAEHLPRVRLVTVGRGSAESESKFRQALKGSAVEFRALGILSAEEVSQVLASADVALFVRGRISTQRSSAISSIAHAVPLVAYADPFLPAALAEAGVVGVRYPDGERLAEATVRVLTDDRLWQGLHQRSRLAHEKYFSWDVVASRFLEVLGRA
jgi:glycosyltransferase involved in cell wall biosynthesis